MQILNQFDLNNYFLKDKHSSILFVGVIFATSENHVFLNVAIKQRES